MMTHSFVTTYFKRIFNTTFIKNKNNSDQLEWHSGQSSCELINVGTGLDIMGKGILVSWFLGKMNLYGSES